MMWSMAANKYLFSIKYTVPHSGLTVCLFVNVLYKLASFWLCGVVIVPTNPVIQKWPFLLKAPTTFLSCAFCSKTKWIIWSHPTCCVYACSAGLGGGFLPQVVGTIPLYPSILPPFAALLGCELEKIPCQSFVCWLHRYIFCFLSGSLNLARLCLRMSTSANLQLLADPSSLFNYS